MEGIARFVEFVLNYQPDPHRVERLQHIVNWFEKYLQGRKINTYDLYPEPKD
jgi:hypothetical protein